MSVTLRLLNKHVYKLYFNLLLTIILYWNQYSNIIHTINRTIVNKISVESKFPLTTFVPRVVRYNERQQQSFFSID